MEEKHLGNRIGIVVQCKFPPLIAHLLVNGLPAGGNHAEGKLPDNEMANGSLRCAHLLAKVVGMRGSQ
jgi:hypothetical protein